MSGSPKLKVYDHTGTYQASLKEPEAAAALIGFYGSGATVRWDHGRTIWTEGEAHDGLAGESYDTAARVMRERVRQ